MSQNSELRTQKRIRWAGLSIKQDDGRHVRKRSPTSFSCPNPRLFLRLCVLSFGCERVWVESVSDTFRKKRKHIIIIISMNGIGLAMGGEKRENKDEETKEEVESQTLSPFASNSIFSWFLFCLFVCFYLSFFLFAAKYIIKFCWQFNIFFFLSLYLPSNLHRHRPQPALSFCSNVPIFISLVHTKVALFIVFFCFWITTHLCLFACMENTYNIII